MRGLPLTEYENAEKQRIADLQNRLTCLRNSSQVVDEYGSPYHSSEIAARLNDVKVIAIDESWLELTAEAAVAKDAAVSKLEQALELATKREAEAAELENLRIQQEAQRQKDLEAAREKEIAERVKREADQAAQVEREASAKREADALAAQQRAEREKKEALEKAEQEKQQAIAAEQLRAQQAEQARLAEQKRIADEAAARAANVEHKRSINQKAVADLVAAGVPEEFAILCIRGIASGKVFATNINY